MIWTGNALVKWKPPPPLSANPVLKPLFAFADSGKSIILDSPVREDLPTIHELLTRIRKRGSGLPSPVLLPPQRLCAPGLGYVQS